MRQIHLKLAAIIVLALCVFLILRQSVGNIATSENPKIPTPSTRTMLPTRTTQEAQPMPNGRITTATTTATDRMVATTLPEEPPVKAIRTSEPAINAPDGSVTNNSVKDSAAQSPISSSASTSDKQALGIQLAEDVQLPAVIIALSDPNRDSEHKVPPPVSAAMQKIVDSFYQELAASVRVESLAVNSVTDADGQETIVIQRGPAVERACANANESYRVLFGDEAFNRLTMSSMLEARLASDSGKE